MVDFYREDVLEIIENNIETLVDEKDKWKLKAWFQSEEGWEQLREMLMKHHWNTLMNEDNDNLEDYHDIYFDLLLMLCN